MENVFHAALSNLGLSVGDIAHQEIRTSGADMRWTDTSAPFVVHTMATSDIDQLTRWIGNDDAMFTSGKLACAAAPTSINVKDPSSALRAAQAYVFGDSSKMRGLKAQIEKALGQIDVQVAAANDIIIDANHPLIIDGSKPKVLVADRLIFTSPQAQLINLGVLTLQATTIIVQG